MIPFLCAVLVLTWQQSSPFDHSLPPRNLIANPRAGEGTAGWELPIVGLGVLPEDTWIEECRPRNPCFGVRNHGGLKQEFALPIDAAGQFVLFVGNARAERTDPAAGITGRPALHVIFRNADGSRFLYSQYMAPANFVHTARSSEEWQFLWGAYRIPVGAAYGILSLQLGERAGVPQNGSRGWIDDIGVYVLPTEAAARTFAASIQANQKGGQSWQW